MAQQLYCTINNRYINDEIYTRQPVSEQTVVVLPPAAGLSFLRPASSKQTFRDIFVFLCPQIT